MLAIFGDRIPKVVPYLWSVPKCLGTPIPPHGAGPYKTFGFMQYSFKSFSISRRYVIHGLGDHTPIGGLPLWHSAIFQSDKQLTHHCPSMIHHGIGQVKHMFVEGSPRDELLYNLGPTWRQVYSNGLTSILRVQPTNWSRPSVWLAAWG